MGRLRDRIIAKKMEIEQKKLEEELMRNPPPPLKPLYVLKVVKGISPDEEITIRADGVNIVESGDIAFIHVDDEGIESICLSIPKGNWRYFYLADNKNQLPVGVERWQGVAGIRVVEKPVPVSQVIEKPVPVMEKTEFSNEVNPVVRQNIEAMKGIVLTTEEEGQDNPQT